MGKKRQPEDQPVGGKAFSFRASPDLTSRLEDVAGGLNLDISNLVRMILTENLAPYERRVRQLREEKGSQPGGRP